MQACRKVVYLTLGTISLAAVIILAVGWTHLGVARAASVSEEIPAKVSYNWDVRPILAQNCFSCHGMDAKHRKADLRLDVADAAFGKLPQNPRKRAIVPGSPRKSELFVRITAAESDKRMPPPESHKTLSRRDIAIIERWIDQGAKYERHWAYTPIGASDPEKSSWDSQAANQVDRYIYANLKRHGLKPSPEADRETLINRVSLALTGLPPTLEQVDAFVADKSPNAYEALVDRLLTSPAHAERMAAVWMDTARFADTSGFLFDTIYAGQYPYRDWVISAFQRNIPYDKFVTWQLAGDLLPNATREQILATAFARAGKKSNEGGIIDEEYRVEYVNERAELVGKAFLGLTVGCAKCHDHKYDVISQADYYSMGGFFNSIDEQGRHVNRARATPNGPTLPWPTADQARSIEIKHAVVVQRENERNAALKAARDDAGARPLPEASQLIAQALSSAQQAYYPMEQVDTSRPFDVLYAKPGDEARKAAPGDTRKGPGGDARKPAASTKSSKAPPPAALVPVSSRPATTPPGRIAQDDLDQAVAKARAAGLVPRGLPADTRGFDAKRLVWILSGVPGQPPAIISNANVVDGPPGKGKALQIDNTVATADKDVGRFDRFDPFTLDLWIQLAGKQYDDVDILHRGATDGIKPAEGYRLSLANNHLRFMLHNSAPFNSVEIVSQARLPVGKWMHVTATYDGSSRAEGARLYIDGAPIPIRILHDHLTRTVMPADSEYVYDGLRFGSQRSRPEFSKGLIDELRVFSKALTPIEVSYLHEPAALSRVAPEVAKSQLVEILAQADARVVAANAKLRAALLEEQAVESKVPQVMVLADSREVRPTYLLQGGLFDKRAKQVPVQALPQVFPYSKDLPANRLGLTRWMFDAKNPLTSRVYVNRLWQMLYGRGLVETVEDFGTQGATPSNPQLLDYLAADFMTSGWDIRHAIKQIVMSSTYRQSSQVTPEALDTDPQNVYLARAPRFRLPAEAIRDSALSASGLLVQQVGGDSVFPYHPAGLWGDTGIQYHAYPEDVPADQYHRRTLYSFIKRNAPFPSLSVFDLADRNGSQVSRTISNTPLQSLVLLNDVQYREAYRKIAERALKASADPDTQLTTVFRLITRRKPSDQELAVLREFHTGRVRRFSEHPADAEKLTSIGVAPVGADLDRTKLAALSAVAAVAFNTPDAYSIR